MKVILIAGGQGTRIAKYYPDIPKPMIPINGVPVMERAIRLLREQGFFDMIITVSHMRDQIMEYFEDGAKFGVSIQYYVEQTALGNAGALYKLKDQLTDDFLLLNADVVFDVDFERMIEFHHTHGGLVTLFTHPNSHPYDSALIVTDENHAVRQWLTKEDRRPDYYKNRVNAGLHIVSPEVLNVAKIDADKIGTVSTETGKSIKVDLDRHILKPLAGTGKMFCYDSSEYVRDIGTPDRLNSVIKDISFGIISAKNYKHKQKAVFLDRDGTINKYVGFLCHPDQMELIEGVADAVKKINNSGYLCIIVTNQPVIARGDITREQLETIHNKLETLLGLEGAYVDAIYYCPHHPDKGYWGEVPELKFECECRKPKPGMLIKAAKDLNVDLEHSYMVGDAENDILAGKAAGCKTVLVAEDHGKILEADYGQDITVSNLLDFAEKICLA